MNNPPPPAKSPRPRIFVRILLAIGWLGVTYFASTGRFSAAHTHPYLARLVDWLGLPESDSGPLNLIFRKIAHVTEYAVLATIFSWVLGAAESPWLRRWWFAAAIAGVALAASLDEFHQSFVPGRDASLRDVLIDICGGLLVLIPIALWRRRADRRAAASQA